MSNHFEDLLESLPNPIQPTAVSFEQLVNAYMAYQRALATFHETKSNSVLADIVRHEAEYLYLLRALLVASSSVLDKTPMLVSALYQLIFSASFLDKGKTKLDELKAKGFPVELFEFTVERGSLPKEPYFVIRLTEDCEVNGKRYYKHQYPLFATDDEVYSLFPNKA